MNGLLASSRRSAQRSALVASRVPRGLTPTAVVAVVGVVFVLIWGQQYTGSVFVLAACYAIVTAGMAVQIGFSQQIRDLRLISIILHKEDPEDLPVPGCTAEIGGNRNTHEKFRWH